LYNGYPGSLPGRGVAHRI